MNFTGLVNNSGWRMVEEKGKKISIVFIEPSGAINDTQVTDQGTERMFEAVAPPLPNRWQCAW
jgi:hypothetical protein